MYQIKQKELEAIHEITSIMLELKQNDVFDKKKMKEAKGRARQARFLINLVIDRWEEERSYA